MDILRSRPDSAVTCPGLVPTVRVREDIDGGGDGRLKRAPAGRCLRHWYVAMAGTVLETRQYLDSRVMPAVFEALRALDAARPNGASRCPLCACGCAPTDSSRTHGHARVPSAHSLPRATALQTRSASSPRSWSRTASAACTTSRAGRPGPVGRSTCSASPTASCATRC